jgi:hypothetical protein
MIIRAKHQPEARGYLATAAREIDALLVADRNGRLTDTLAAHRASETTRGRARSGCPAAMPDERRRAAARQVAVQLTGSISRGRDPPLTLPTTHWVTDS